MNRRVWVLIFALFSFSLLVAQGHDHDGDGHDDHATHDDHSGHDHDSGDAHAEGDHDDHGSCGMSHSTEYNAGGTAFHHIADQNVFSIGPKQFPLPVMIYNFESGFDGPFSSGKFHADHHGDGAYAVDGYILYHGVIKKIKDPSFPKGMVNLGAHKVFYEKVTPEGGGKAIDKFYACYQDKLWEAESESTIDAGLFGGGMTSFIDLSITKNVVTMIATLIFAFFFFGRIRKAYQTRDGLAPTGSQNLFEIIFVFMRDEVLKPFIGNDWERFMPFVMSLFFAILLLNLIGQVPFFGNPNVTGQLAFTLVLAVLVFIIVNINGNKDYWGHVFWMPGIPWWVKLIVTPVEIMGLFLKPITLMLRLFGNIVAGHMVIVIFVGLIFIFGQSGANPGAGWGASIGSALLSLFMMAIELLVAFIQAFVFALLTASYIGAAVEEHDHH